MWAKLAPLTLKKLGAWIEHFLKRLQQYNEWLTKDDLPVIWLSGLHIPESYLTALVQTTCRKKKWALDKSTLYTDVTKIKDANDIKKKPDNGCYITGLFLEGAQWDFEKQYLKRQKYVFSHFIRYIFFLISPKELIIQMPIIQIIPVEANKLKLKGK